MRLDAESAATGVSKAELIRRSIALLLDHAERPKRSRELPVFDSGRSLTPDEMNESVYEHIKERAARR
ncbi:ribbon-helix-helix protein, CopG family [Streptomyces cyaneofuscatus]|uniref:ribbon-helix-helix protein, CopG family n=1 Tax=Streptomyces cyaneofuscatus TaxID=66883 RepID=UPI0003697BEB